MTVPYIFASATAPLPLSQLDSNFATAITLGSTSLTLGSTVTSVAGLTLTSPTITGGTSTATQNLANVTGTLAVGNGGTGLTTLTAGYIPYGNGTSAFSSGALVVSGANLGVGVSPNTWYTGSSVTAIQQIGGLAAWSYLNGGTSPRVALSSNVYFNSSAGYTYLNTDYASIFSQGVGAFTWSTAASGTAGTSASFTQAMTLDNSGNLALGTTTATGRMSVSTGSGVVCFRDYNQAIGSGTGSALDFLDAARTSVVDGGLRATNLTLFSSGATPLLMYTNGSERARIDSSGNFQVGNYGGTAKINSYGNSPLRLYDATLGNQSDLAFPSANTLSITSYYSTGSNITFGTNSSGGGNVERARIDSSGNLLVGTTSTSGSSSNTASAVSGIFRSYTASVNASTATATTITTLTTGINACYLVNINVNGVTNDATNYSAFATIITNGTTARIANSSNGTLCLITLSGLNVQVTQSSGSTQTCYATLTRIA